MAPAQANLEVVAAFSFQPSLPIDRTAILLPDELLDPLTVEDLTDIEVSLRVRPDAVGPDELPRLGIR